MENKTHRACFFFRAFACLAVYQQRMAQEQVGKTVPDLESDDRENYRRRAAIEQAGHRCGSGCRTKCLQVSFSNKFIFNMKD